MNNDGFEPGQTLGFDDLLRMRGKPAPSLPTREDIAAMPKAEVIEWLKAHGVEEPAGRVAELRDALTAIMFVE